MKKMLAIIAATAMLGTLVSCGKDTAGSTAESSAAETTTAETSAESSEESSEEESSVSDPLPRDVGPVDANAITFEDDDLHTAHQMGGGGDETDVEMGIVDLDGDKKLKIHAVRDDASKDYGVVKIVFNLPEMLGLENVGNIGHITVDFTCIANEMWKNDDGSESLVVGNFLGALAGNIASEKGTDEEGNLIQNTWSNHYEFAYQDWEHSEGSWRCETDIPAKGIPANGYAANDEGTTLVIMRWGQKNDVDIYIDNITFYDKDGNSMPVLASGTAEGAESSSDAAAEESTDAESSESSEESSESAAE
ncbi:MAG: hypothetical protein IJM46_15270 [Oscillospiraceae bacterium]|nr:hypothetical protein [Oscillospiraceae bacterium]